MKKSSYIAPVVEITKWKTEDVITTSGLASVTNVVSAIGDSNVTRSVNYTELK